MKNLKAEKKEKEISWFDNPEVFHIPIERQREVVLNPGRDFEWFSKVYPVYGKVSFSRKVYIDDLPARCKGKIVAVTAVPSMPSDKQKEFERYKQTLPYIELSVRGMLKPKPIGTYYELFESSTGYRTWTNPSEYYNVNDKRSNKRPYKRVSENPASSGVRLGQIEALAQGLRLKGTDTNQNNSTTGFKRKS